MATKASGKPQRKVYYAAYNHLTKSYVKIASPSARKRNQMLSMGNYSLLKIAGLP
jgi:CRISPR/Cas system-associated endonuclease Cas1